MELSTLVSDNCFGHPCLNLCTGTIPVNTLYYVRIDEDEIEGFFDEAGGFVAAWCINDAHWRHEYMNPLLYSLGYNVMKSQDPDLEKSLRGYFHL